MDKRYIFIDGGSHQGPSIKWFERSAIFDHYPWEIFAFEANPNMTPCIERSPYLAIIEKAIWISDGIVDFYLAKETENSTLLRQKRQGGMSKTPISVRSIDFGRWLEDTFDKNDYIVVKFDIEGAEYVVLDQMIADGSINYITALFVEFHDTMVKIPKSRNKGLLDKLDELDIPCWELGRFSQLLKGIIFGNKLREKG